MTLRRPTIAASESPGRTRKAPRLLLSDWANAIMLEGPSRRGPGRGGTPRERPPPRPSRGDRHSALPTARPA